MLGQRAAVLGVAREQRRRKEAALGEGGIGRAAVVREPVQIPDIEAEGAYEGRMREEMRRTGLRAVLAMFEGAYRLSKRQIRQLAADMFALAISTGMSPQLARPSAGTPVSSAMARIKVANRSIA